MESVKVNTSKNVYEGLKDINAIRYTCNKQLLDTFVVTGKKKRKALYALIEKESHQGKQKMRLSNRQYPSVSKLPFRVALRIHDLLY